MNDSTMIVPAQAFDMGQLASEKCVIIKDTMIIKVKERRNGEPRELEAIFFSKNKIDSVRTVDPKTGHDLQDHLFDDLIWDITIEQEDLEKFKLEAAGNDEA